MPSLNIAPPLSIWIQLASFFFSSAGIHSDLLIIRLFLSLAYLMLFLNATMGSPLWPDATSPGRVAVDVLFWSFLGLYVHGASLVHLILDERKVELSEEEEALWRMFYRTGGLSMRLFQTMVAANMEVVNYPPHEHIPTEDFFYILYKGQVDLYVYGEANELKVERTLGSAEMFDVAYLGFFSDDSFFVKNQIRCQTITRAQVFRFSRSAMKKIAPHHFAKDVWQSLLINNLSKIVESERNGRPEQSGDDACDPIFNPLEDWEQPKQTYAGSNRALKNPLGHLVQYIVRSFSPPWPFGGHPTGIRQVLLPAPAQQATRPHSSSTLPTISFHS